MAEKETLERVRRDKREGKSPSTQAGEFVREEMHHIREGKHGAKNTKQAIAIALSKARKAGVALPPYRGKDVTPGAPRARRARKYSEKRSRAALSALKREPRTAASHRALSRHAKQAHKGVMAS